MKEENARTNLPTITPEDVAEYLLRKSSADHKVSRKEITGAMYRLRHKEREAPDTAVYRSSVIDQATRKRVNEILMDNVNLPLLAGITIMCEVDPSRCGYDEKVFYARSLLTEPQINILRDSIAVYPYIEREETKKIIDALNSITPEFNRCDYDPDIIMAKKYNGSCYKNIIEITKAFAKYKYDKGGEEFTGADSSKTISEYERSFRKGVMKIRFKYCAYNADKRLQLRTPHKMIDENDPCVREVNPAKLMWVNGYYYLVTYSYNGDHKPVFINYRVDRMIDTVCTDIPAEKLPPEFSEDEYRYKNPVMYSSDDDSRRKKIVMKCSADLINNIIDTFGLGVYIRKLDEKNVIVNIHDTAPTGVKMWALEYYYGCEILEPKFLRDEMRAAAENMLGKYSEEKQETQK